MQHISYTDFKENMDTYMDQIAEGDMVTVRREDNANVVLLPETKYDALVRRHIVGGANRTLFSVDLPPRLCRTGT